MCFSGFGEPPKEIGGIVALPVGGFGVCVFVANGEQQHRRPHEKFERDSKTSGR
jgi:hypothetical protein